MLKLSILWTGCLFLFPFILIQGLLVRRRAMRLPEAAGSKDGGDTGDLMVVLGDSVVVGVGVENMQEALPARLAQQLSAKAGRAFSWRAIGANGDRLSDVLLNVPKLAFLDQKPSLIVVNVGVNDVSRLTSMTRWQLQLTTLVSEVKQKYGVPLVLLGLPPMHAFPLLPQPLRFALGIRARMLDLSLKRIASLLSGVYYLSAELPLNEEFMAVDGYHPSASGVEQWTRELVSALDEELIS